MQHPVPPNGSHRQFYNRLDNNNTIIISGNDTNASIGMRLNDYCELDCVADEQSSQPTHSRFTRDPICQRQRQRHQTITLNAKLSSSNFFLPK
eukprot:scaffold336211_cov55-Attheya_sp.AAC.1